MILPNRVAGQLFDRNPRRNCADMANITGGYNTEALKLCLSWTSDAQESQMFKRAFEL
jgi:hypothetical protein